VEEENDKVSNENKFNNEGLSETVCIPEKDETMQDKNAEASIVKKEDDVKKGDSAQTTDKVFLSGSDIDILEQPDESDDLDRLIIHHNLFEITSADIRHDSQSETGPNKKIEIQNIGTYKNNIINNYQFKDKFSNTHTDMNTNPQESTEQRASDGVMREGVLKEDMNNILKRLHVLSNLPAGYKLWLKEDEKHVLTFTIDDSYLSRVYRTWDNTQGRERTINAIVDDTNYISQNIASLRSKGKAIVLNALKSAEQGVKNLRQTYAGTKAHEDALDQVLITWAKLTQMYVATSATAPVTAQNGN